MASGYITQNWESTTAKFPVNIWHEVDELKEEIIENRRWFHQYPELSFEEHKTSAKVAALLKSYGIVEVWENIGRTGVVALVRGENPGPCIALRADMVLT